MDATFTSCTHVLLATGPRGAENAELDNAFDPDVSIIIAQKKTCNTAKLRDGVLPLEPVHEA